MDAASLQRLIRGRRSIRRYQPRPVPQTVLERLLEAAIWAPSAHNRQPWRFAVITTDATRAALAQAMGERLRADRLADGDPPEAVARDIKRSQARLTGAPALILACLTLAGMDRYPDERRARAEYLMAVQSTALALQNLLLAAHAEGLGACWLCAPLFCPMTVLQTLDLPADWEPQGLITLGYPDEDGRRPTRRPPEACVVWR